jgi:phosphoribosylanthranilate isomerase
MNGGGRTPEVRIKICGLTRSEDARLAVLLGADYLGFIFAASPRQTAADAVEAMVRTLEQEQAQAARFPERVGVFVNTERKLIEQTARQARLTMLQLHGDEDPDFCNQFELPVIKALRVSGRRILELVEPYQCPYILLDPYVKGQYGGTGIEADWKLVAEVVRTFPDKRFFLAGGLGPENVRAAVLTVKPFAVDASSALERLPGLKDRRKMSNFVKAVRNT